MRSVRLDVASGRFLSIILSACLWLGVGPLGVEAAQRVSSTTGKTMVVTVDDLPMICTCRDLADWQSLTDGLVQTLATHAVPAIGFVNENKLFDAEAGTTSPVPARVELLRAWLDAGLELGNHSNTHPSLNRTPLPRFEQDVLDGERVTRRLLSERGRTPRFFRHPFLHTGRDLETKRGFEGFLEEHDYRVAPVTVDNSEWIFARAYDLALDKGDDTLAKRIAEAYGPYMESKISYYEDLAERIFGRRIPQILLIHANRLNADHLGALLTRIEQRGYTFVDLETALSDPAFEHEDTYVGPAGLSWIERWWMTAGLSREAFKSEPPAPQWVLAAAGIDSE